MIRSMSKATGPHRDFKNKPICLHHYKLGRQSMLPIC